MCVGGGRAWQVLANWFAKKVQGARCKLGLDALCDRQNFQGDHFGGWGCWVPLLTVLKTTMNSGRGVFLIK